MKPFMRPDWRPCENSEIIFALRPLQKNPDQENQGTNNPEEDLGILGPLPILHFPLTFSQSRRFMFLETTYRSIYPAACLQLPC